MTANDRRTKTARARSSSRARKPRERVPDGHEGPGGGIDNPDIPDDSDDRE